MVKPIFYDPTGKRQKRSLIGFIALIGAAVFIFLTLLISIMMVQIPPQNDLKLEYPQKRGLLTNTSKRPLRPEAIRFRAHPNSVNQTISAFYVPWNDSSRASFVTNVNRLDMVMPALGFLRARTPADPPGKGPVFFYQAAPFFHHVLDQARHRPMVLDVVQNAQNGLFDPRVMTEVLSTPASRKTLMDGIEGMITREKAQGVVLDFENLPDNMVLPYLQFVRELHARFMKKGLWVTVTVEVEDRHWPLKAFSEASDRIFIMDYDEHALDDPPGPIASQAYFTNRLNWALAQFRQKNQSSPCLTMPMTGLKAKDRPTI